MKYIYTRGHERILSRKKMAKNLRKKLLFNAVEAELFVELFVEEITEALCRGEAVELDGFGKFTISRVAYENPIPDLHTGLLYCHLPYYNVYFRPTPKLRRRVAHLTPDDVENVQYGKQGRRGRPKRKELGIKEEPK